MTLTNVAGLSAALALLSSTAAFADVTPEEVWAKWQEFSAAFGQTVTADSETRDGDALIIEGLVVSGGDDTAQATVTIPRLAFTDLGDGSVEVTMSDTYQMTVTSPDADTGEPVKVAVDITAPGAKIVTSGTANAMVHALDAAEMTIALASINDVAADALGVVVDGTLKGMTGTYSSDTTDGLKLSTDVSTDSVAINVKMDDAATGNKVNFALSMAELASNSAAFLPADVDTADMAAMMAAGLSGSGETTFGALTFSFDYADPTGNGAGSGALAGGNVKVSLDQGEVAYGFGTTGLELTVAGSTIPLPEVKVGLGELAFDFLMPLAKTDEPTDFSFLTRIVDLSVSDDIWAMVDPAATFPRDPVTFVLDTKGTVKLLADLTDEAAMAAFGEAPQAEIYSMDLNELQLKALGAEVNGEGALTFDNTDMTTFPGMPKPDGSITLNASGLNALLEMVKAAGLVPEEELMGFQMMLGMFAVPGDGEDTMTTTIEFKDGGLFANGMQLQ